MVDRLELLTRGKIFECEMRQKQDEPTPTGLRSKLRGVVEGSNPGHDARGSGFMVALCPYLVKDLC